MAAVLVPLDVGSKVTVKSSKEPAEILELRPVAVNCPGLLDVKLLVVRLPWPLFLSRKVLVKVPPETATEPKSVPSALLGLLSPAEIAVVPLLAKRSASGVDGVEGEVVNDWMVDQLD